MQTTRCVGCTAVAGKPAPTFDPGGRYFLGLILAVASATSGSSGQ